MGAIPPIPDPLGTGIPQCPDGYHYDPTTNTCLPNNPPPVDPTTPTFRSFVTEMAERNFDPAQAYKVGMQGVKDSGILERFIVGLLRAGIKLLAPLIEEAASLLDDVLAILAEVFQAAQGQHSTGYYLLAGQMVTDLMGVETDGNALAAEFRSGGRQAAMVALGGKIFDVIAAEFANIAQTGATGAFTVAPGQGIGGLPAVTLSPTQGVAGAKAFLGYLSAFAIREGNTDMLAAYLPHGIGEMFKDFAEDFSKNLGIGRMARQMWKPLITTMVATPLQQAMNLEYRPTLYDVGQAVRAFITGDLSDSELAAELALHGWNDKRQQGVFWQHAKSLDWNDIHTLAAVGSFQDTDVALWGARLGHTSTVLSFMQQAEDLRPARAECLAAARHFAQQYLQGRITREQYAGAIDSVKNKFDGSPMLSAGEVQAFLSLPVIASAAPRRHLSLIQLTRQYENGLITLQEFSDGAASMGFSVDDVRLLEQELLIEAKRASDRAAKAANAALRGRFAKLTVAQMKTAFENGLMTLPEVAAELTTRGYAPDSITAIENEFRIAAKLQPPGTPTA
jgi:hypothetical protein